MPLLIRRLFPPFHQRDELIAHVDKSGVGSATPQFEGKNPPIERQRLVDISDLKCDMIDPDDVRLRFFIHVFLVHFVLPADDGLIVPFPGLAHKR